MNRGINFTLAIVGIALVMGLICYQTKTGPFAIEEILSDINNPVVTTTPPTVTMQPAPANATTTPPTPKKADEAPAGIGIVLEAEPTSHKDLDSRSPVKNRQGNPMVSRVVPGLGADKAGLRPGDGIKSIRNEGDNTATSTTNMTFKQLVDALRGKEGSTVIIEVDALPKPVEIKRSLLK